MRRRALALSIVLAIVAGVMVAGGVTYYVINQKAKIAPDEQIYLAGQLYDTEDRQYAGGGSSQPPPKRKENTEEPKENLKKKPSDIPPKTKLDPKKPIDHKTMVEDVIAGKYDMKCTFHTAEASGVLYVHKKNMRMESNTPAGKGYSIILGHNAYTWLAGKSQGALFTNAGTSAKSNKYSLEKYVNNRAKYHLKCQKVDTLDPSMFQVPKNISFIDQIALLKSAGISIPK